MTDRNGNNRSRRKRGAIGDEGLSRRQLLRWGSLGLAGLALGPTTLVRTSGAASRGNRLVILNLFGGNDDLNTLVPYAHDAYYRARPNLAIAPESVLPIDGTYGWNPRVPRMAELMRRGQLAVIHQVGYPEPNFSHFESMSIWSRGIRGFRDSVDRRGWIGRLADHYMPEPTDVVGIGVGPVEDLNTDRAQPLNLQNLDSFDFYRLSYLGPEETARREAARGLFQARSHDGGDRGALAATTGRAYEFVDILRSRLERYPDNVAYPDTDLGTLLRDTARLIATDLGTRIVYTGMGGFDTHATQGQLHPELLSELDGALSAFVRDLQGLREWDRTMLLVISEFGRTTFENGSEGTDHGSSGMMLAVGSRLRGTQFGPGLADSDLLEERRPTDYAVDFRSVYKEIIGTHLGVDPGPVFPEPEDRPVRLGLL